MSLFTKIGPFCYRLADHILRTSLIILKVTNCVSEASFDCLHKHRK